MRWLCPGGLPRRSKVNQAACSRTRMHSIRAASTGCSSPGRGPVGAPKSVTAVPGRRRSPEIRDELIEERRTVLAWQGGSAGRNPPGPAARVCKRPQLAQPATPGTTPKGGIGRFEIDGAGKEGFIHSPFFIHSTIALGYRVCFH